jgi:hypothetical protein
MAVFRDMEISWRGKDYTITPTMRLMRQIEMGDISLTDIAVRTSQGRPPISHISFVLARLLNAAGAAVAEDEVYEELINGDQDAVGEMMLLVLTAFTPGERDQKKAVAQTESQSSETTPKAKGES